MENKSIDCLFCGHSYHWCDKSSSKSEFFRILKPTGNIVLAWNQRSGSDGLQKEYEQILNDNIADYKNVSHRNIPEPDIIDFFSPKEFHTTSVPNSQIFDRESLKGRLKSSSYCPKEGPAYERLMGKMGDLFHKYEVNDHISFNYETHIYWC